MESKIYSPDLSIKIPELPGIYAWYIQYGKNTKAQVYHDVFKQKEFRSLIKGTLQDSYEGCLSAKPYPFLEDIQNLDLLMEGVRQFSPPLYIGISVNLRQRIRTHLSSLNEFLYSRRPSYTAEISEMELDSEIESNYFAQRIGAVIKQNMDSLDINSFFIKVIELDKHYPKSGLLEVEKFLNRTFIPHYGRR